MCEPTTIALAAFALSSASSVAAYQSQKSQSEYAKKAATTQRNSNIAAVAAESAMGQQDEAERVEALRRQTESKKATARASAAEAGVTGISVDSVLNELAGQGAEAQQNLETNYARSSLGTAAQLTNINSQYSNTLAQNQAPSALGLGLEIGQAGLSSYGSFKSMKAADKIAKGA